jgi:hypothetical protein
MLKISFTVGGLLLISLFQSLNMYDHRVASYTVHFLYQVSVVHVAGEKIRLLLLSTLFLSV